MLLSEPAFRLMITRPLGKQDYDHIVQIIDRWWGGPTTALAHPIFFYELGAMARVVEDEGILVGFLLGFVAPGPPKTGYVHLVGIHPDYRRRGVGKVLYQTFKEDSRAAGCMRLKAITTLGNEGSIAFLSGSVFNAAGRSVPNAKVELFRILDDGTTKKIDGRITTETGSFKFRLSPEPGKYRVSLKADGSEPISKDVEIDGAAVYRVALSLPPKP